MVGSIAVGIGGAGGWQALAWAAEEAERTGARLVLLHVCVPGSPLDQATGEPTPAEVELIDPPLARAYAQTQTRLGGQRAALRIRSGEPSARLADASTGVRLLVIGAGESGRTVRRVLRHAHCPVVVVRPDALSVGSPLLAGHVVIGVDGTDAGRAAMEFAFTYAAKHHLPLAAVHVSEATRDDYFYDDTTLSTHFTVEPADLELLAAETEPWASKCPAVPVRRVVLHGSVVDALIRAGAGARLLVVGDKRRGVIGRARTGDVPLTVATEAPCPVAVVPLDQREGEPL
ncbi:universal stress protein [Actinoplanes sp. NPDC024001]|uniref:universal stress protein n=1 Tax=Actinoplanes sp. NPDC024001 TaxID=3154598 RepID=UPI0033CD83A7